MKWTPEKDQQLKSLYPNKTNREVAEILGATESAINARAFILNLFKTKEFHRERASKSWYGKGHIPQNKGRKWSEYMSIEGQNRSRKTTFKKGNTPKNHLPVGTEMQERKDGYIKVKIAEPNKWMLKHRLVWERHNGPIPKGHNVQFANKDKTDCRIENLYLISRKEQINQNSIVRYPGEIRKAMTGISKIQKLIREHENKYRRTKQPSLRGDRDVEK